MVSSRSAAHSLGESSLSFSSSSYVRHMNFTVFSLLVVVRDRGGYLADDDPAMLGWRRVPAFRHGAVGLAQEPGALAPCGATEMPHVYSFCGHHLDPALLFRAPHGIRRRRIPP